MNRIVPTPADRAATHEGVARENLAEAVRVTDKYTKADVWDGTVTDAAWECRLLLVGALTDPLVDAVRGRKIVRKALLNAMHDGSRSRPALAVYRRCLGAVDGKK